MNDNTQKKLLGIDDKNIAQKEKRMMKVYNTLMQI